MPSQRSTKAAEAISRHMHVWVTWPVDERTAAIAEGLDDIFAADSERLWDALRGLLDYVEEGCPAGGYYAVTEAKAALVGIKAV